jgi:DNA-binding response OmpR family regulator
MPDGNGVTFVKALRRGGHTVPVLIITARSSLDDRVIGLDSGGDDYLVKPFELRELAARCRALLRRPARASAPRLRWPISNSIRRGGKCASRGASCPCRRVSWGCSNA